MKKIAIITVVLALVFLVLLTGCSNKTSTKPIDKSSSSLEKNTQGMIFKDNFDNYKLSKFPKKNWISANRYPASKVFEKSPGNQAFKLIGRRFEDEYIQGQNSLKNLDQYMTLEFDLYIPKIKNTLHRQNGSFSYLGICFYFVENGDNFMIFDDIDYKRFSRLQFNTNYHIKVEFNNYDKSCTLSIFDKNIKLINKNIKEFVRDTSEESSSKLTYVCALGEYSIDNVIVKAWH